MVLLRVRGDGRVYVPSLPVECSISIESGGLSVECRGVIVRLIVEEKMRSLEAVVVFLCKSDWNVTVAKQSQPSLSRCQAIDQISRIKIKKK